jgi:hypothetical protein
LCTVGWRHGSFIYLHVRLPVANKYTQPVIPCVKSFAGAA